jgi:hypothetical protein
MYRTFTTCAYTLKENEVSIIKLHYNQLVKPLEGRTVLSMTAAHSIFSVKVNIKWNGNVEIRGEN